MFVNEVNETKIYNLSAGKSVPEVSWFKYYRIGALNFMKMFSSYNSSGLRTVAKSLS